MQKEALPPYRITTAIIYLGCICHHCKHLILHKNAICCTHSNHIKRVLQIKISGPQAYIQTTAK